MKIMGIKQFLYAWTKNLIGPSVPPDLISEGCPFQYGDEVVVKGSDRTGIVDSYNPNACGDGCCEAVYLKDCAYPFWPTGLEKRKNETV
jgi:hypothetical protein